MPISPDEFHAQAMRTADADGRLSLSRMADWDVFPFERDGLRVVPLERPQLPEPARNGEDGSPCEACACGRPVIWSDANWRLWLMRQSGVPLALQLESVSHYDLPGLQQPQRQLGVLGDAPLVPAAELVKRDPPDQPHSPGEDRAVMLIS